MQQLLAPDEKIMSITVFQRLVVIFCWFELLLWLVLGIS